MIKRYNLAATYIIVIVLSNKLNVKLYAQETNFCCVNSSPFWWKVMYGMKIQKLYEIKSKFLKIAYYALIYIKTTTFSTFFHTFLWLNKFILIWIIFVSI